MAKNPPTRPAAAPASRHAWWLIAGCLLHGCAGTQSTPQAAMPPGTRWHDAVQLAGPSTVKFSYRTDGRKYDVVTFAKASTSAVFEDSRLFAVVAPEAMAGFDHALAAATTTTGLPLEHGPAPIHRWVLAQRLPHPAAPPPHTTAAGVAEGAAQAVILAPLAPLFIAGGVCAGAEYAMTGKDRRRSQQVNDALAAADVSYRGFLAQLPAPDMHAANGTYQVNEHLATKGSFFTWNEFYYDVGLRDGRVQWVAYQVEPIRRRTCEYWAARRAAAGS